MNFLLFASDIPLKNFKSIGFMTFVPVGVSNRDKRPLSPLLARLAVGPGTKAIYCPGPKGCRDK